MPVMADLVAYLDPLVSETAGTNLFEGPMPELPNDAVALDHYGGEPPEDRVMGASLSASGVYPARVQLMVRSTDMATAITKANAYYALLDNFGTAQLSGRTYFDIESMDGEPFSIGQDQNSRWRFVANFRIRKARG